MRSQVFLEIILLKINMLKLDVLTKKWSFLCDKPQTSENVPLLPMTYFDRDGGSFGIFGRGSVAHRVRYGMAGQTYFFINVISFISVTINSRW